MNKLILISIIFILSSYSVHSFDNELKFTENSNKISLKLLNVLPQNQNHFYSPLSITYSLYALLNGADGQTESELKNLLSIGSNDTLQSLNSDIKTTLNSLREKNINEVVVRFANRILLSDAYNLSESFEDSIKNEFNSSVDSVDFMRNASQIKDQVNDWVRGQTNGKIDTLFESLTNDTAFVISNALYFSAEWDTPFDPHSTGNGQFYGLDGNQRTVQMMRTMRKFRYKIAQTINASLIELPFIEGSNTSMIILLPNERNGLNQIIEALDSETLSTELSVLFNASKSQVNLTFPKFDIETDYNLKTPLSDLGLSSMFTSEADLSRITGAKNLKLSQAIHKAVLNVRESGVEASAAVGMVGVPHIWIPPIDVTVDRPFLFLIQDTQSGLLLFMGQVYEPNSG